MNPREPKLPRKEAPFTFKIDIEVCDGNLPGGHLKFEVTVPPLPAKLSQVAFIPDGPHRIRMLVPNIGPQGIGQPTPHGMDHAMALRLLGELALCLALTTPTKQNQEEHEDHSQN